MSKHNLSSLSTAITDDILWHRICAAVQAVRNRLERVCATLESAEIPYAVCGGNAVAFWVGLVDEAAVRNAKDVDILVRRNDLVSAMAALERVGFNAADYSGRTTFLHCPSADVKGWVRTFIAGEKVRDDSLEIAPDVDESERPTTYRVLSLEPLVRMELSTRRSENGMHLRDLIEAVLIDASWINRLSAALGDRLEEILANLDG